MPLIQGKSRKAMSKNIKTEMEHGKPQKQAIAIAYAVKRKNSKKKASGGTVESGSPDMNMAHGGMYAEGGEISANREKRPMPENEYFDREEVSRNAHKRPNGPDGWLDQPTVKQAQSNNGRMVKPIKHPKMVPSDSFSTCLRDEEDDLEMSASPGPYGERPPEHDNEEGPNRQGHPVRDMERQHNNGRKPYAAGGMAIDEDREERRERSDEAHMQSELSPSEDEAHMYADKHNEEGPDRHGPDLSDHEEPHSEHDRMYRDNMHSQPDDLNPAHDKHSEDDSEDQPEDESQLMHEASIAAAIMAKRRKMYKGGAILEHRDQDDVSSHDSIYSDDSDQADLSRNADEDANEEDQLSFDAIKKENYSETPALEESTNPMDAAMHGDDEEMDSHDRHDRDMISTIRRKMKTRSPITR